METRNGQAVGVGQYISFSTPVGEARGYVIQVTNALVTTVVPGQVVRLSTAANRSIIATSGAGQTRGAVVVIGGVSGAQVFIALSGEFPVTCTTAAITAGDVLATSATAGQGATNASGPGAGTGFAWALTAKGAGSAGDVMGWIAACV